MPSKNSIKQYLEDGYYHIYNRGIDKRMIFMDDLDYKMFLSYLKNYLMPPHDKQVRPIRKSTLFAEIELVAYCLMPNHFHLLVKQKNKTAITHFMRSLMNAYTKYFNTRHKRIGTLFQGRYKAALILEDAYLLHLSRYIHSNPREISAILAQYPYSSYGDYLGKRKTLWLKPQEILGFFNSAQKTGMLPAFSYESFVEDSQFDSEAILGELTLEQEEENNFQVRPV